MDSLTDLYSDVFSWPLDPFTILAAFFVTLIIVAAFIFCLIAIAVAYWYLCNDHIAHMLKVSEVRKHWKKGDEDEWE